MKRRYLLLVIVLATSLLPLGCSNKIVKNVALASDKVIIDEDTKKSSTENGKVNFDLVAETEPIDPGTIYSMTTVDENIIQLTYQNEGNILNSLRIGTVSDEKNSDNQNKINWENVDVSGELFTEASYYNINETRVKKDRKYHKIEKDGSLKEITAYTELIDKYGNIQGLEHFSFKNGTIDMVQIGEVGKIDSAIVDVLNDKYYFIPKDVAINGEDSIINILGIDGDKIYMTTGKFDMELNSETGVTETTNKEVSIGYLENGKFTKILSPEDGVKIEAGGDMIYENGRILFSGIAEGKNGIWNYNIENKKLSKIVDVENNTFFEFHINDTNNKIIMNSRKMFNSEERKSPEYTLSIADINEKLEISNITNIVTNKEERKYKAFNGWSEDGTKFYIRSTIADENYNATSVYQIYQLAE